jgi:hypothetical protein
MKKRVRLTQIDLKSLFRAVIITSVIPLLIYLALALLSGSFVSVLQVVLAPVTYGLVMMLLGASYNWLAPKYGGIEVEVTIK